VSPKVGSPMEVVAGSLVSWPAGLEVILLYYMVVSTFGRHLEALQLKRGGFFSSGSGRGLLGAAPTMARP
jgi:hypothetical protein